MIGAGKNAAKVQTFPARRGVNSQRGRFRIGGRGKRENGAMKITRWQIGKAVAVAALGMSLAGSIGCQTWVAGMTLPSGYYLDHRPQYFRPDPDFPLQNELSTMQGQDALANGGGRPAEVPAQPGR
jgi:hypothetical protein